MLIITLETREIEVVDTRTYGGIKYILARIISGKNWQSWTHGGWAEETEKLLRADLVVDCPCRVEEIPDDLPLLDVEAMHEHRTGTDDEIEAQHEDWLSDERMKNALRAGG